MEGFKTNPKMAKTISCYKEGGSVKYKSRHSEKSEMKEDIAKDKAIVKKAVKMHDEQLHEGKDTNLSKLKKGGRMKKEGGKIKRYQAGGMAGQGAVSDMERNTLRGAVGQGAISDTERLRLLNRAKNRAMLSPSQQKELDAQEAAAALKGQGAVSEAERGTLRGIMGRKKGGKAC